MSLKFAVAASLTVLCGVPAQADDQAANLGPIGALTSPFSPESAEKPDARDASSTSQQNSAANCVRQMPPYRPGSAIPCRGK